MPKRKQHTQWVSVADEHPNQVGNLRGFILICWLCSIT